MKIEQIFTFWQGPMNYDVQRSLESWKKQLQLPITVLSRKDVPQNTVTKLLAQRSTQALSDWVRLWILSTRGGLWIDATFFINDGTQLRTLIAQAERWDSQLMGYSSWGLQLDRRFPVVESWLLGAGMDSALVSNWLREFELASLMGFNPYRRFIELQGINAQKIYQVVGGEYLTIHACLQAVLQRNPALVDTMCLSFAERGPFHLHIGCGWDPVCIGKELADKADLYPMIKICGRDRVWRDRVQFVRNILPFLFVLCCLMFIVSTANSAGVTI